MERTVPRLSGAGVPRCLGPSPCASHTTSTHSPHAHKAAAKSESTLKKNHVQPHRLHRSRSARPGLGRGAPRGSRPHGRPPRAGAQLVPGWLRLPGQVGAFGALALPPTGAMDEGRRGDGWDVPGPASSCVRGR